MMNNMKHTFYIFTKFINIINMILILLLATFISHLYVNVTLNYSNVSIIYILAIIIISIYTPGYYLGIISAVLSVACNNYFFTFPLNELDFTKNGHPLTLTSMLIISVITSALTVHTKKQATEAYELVAKTNKLNDINTKLLSANGLAYISELTIDYVQKLTGHTVIFYFNSPQLGDKGIIKSMDIEHEIILHSYHEKFIANWVFENKERAGVGTNFCGNSSSIYFPFISHQKVWGVIGIYCPDEKSLSDNTITYISLMMSQVAMALERQYLSDNQHRMMVETEKETMRANLLRAVSHDLRTPLTGMIGASETLANNLDTLPQKEQLKLITYIYEDSNWLLNMVENLLSVTRIKEDGSSVKKILEPLEEVVSESISRVKKRYKDAKIEVEVPKEYILIPMDATLIEQVIINLIENALKHANTSLPVEFKVTKEETMVIFQIIDHGKGLPINRIDYIFDGYTPTPNGSIDSSKGSGIGLTICKTIITAHGGTITARNGLNKGSIFTFCLPLKGGTSIE
jgi:two-component system sensor histidine kinase KdpD